MSGEYLSLPPDLPAPVDDGAADHLPGRTVPRLWLASTAGAMANVAALGGQRAVLYLYPRTGVPGIPSPDGWDLIPGARGCTPQACDFRDHHTELSALGATVHGLSSQSPAEQAEATERLHLPFPLLADPELALAAALALPTFTVDALRLYRRLTLIIRETRIEHVFYPVFPPDQHAAQVLRWLRANG